MLVLPVNLLESLDYFLKQVYKEKAKTRKLIHATYTVMKLHIEVYHYQAGISITISITTINTFCQI